MKRLRLSPDYFCYPVWHDDGEITEEFGDIDPRTLRITDSLAADLIAWSDWFDRGIDMDDFRESKWSEEDKKAFYRAGEQLLERLRAELGSGFSVRKGFT